MATRKTGRKAGRRPASNLKSSRREGGMTVREAGRLGGLVGGRKGGLTVKAERGVRFYQEIGKLGGERVRDLIAAGKKATERARRRDTRPGR
jgi:hypothetical protein